MMYEHLVSWDIRDVTQILSSGMQEVCVFVHPAIMCQEALLICMANENKQYI